MKTSLLTLLALIAISTGCRSSQALLHVAQSQPVAPVVVDEVVPAVAKDSSQRSIQDYVVLGLAHNPKVAEAMHRLEALRCRVPQQVALPDPTVNTTTHLEPVQTAAGEQAFALGVSQKFINNDRRVTRARVALEEVRAAEENLKQVQNETAEGIRSICYQLVYVRNSIKITQQDIESLAQIAEVILSRYEVKQSVTQQDVLNVQVEQSAIENQLRDWQRKERALRARLGRMVNLSPKSTLEITDELQIDSHQLDLDALTDLAVSGHPELAAQLALVRRDRKNICLAMLQNKPDMTIGLNWINTSSSGISPVANGDDSVLLGVGFNLPIYKDRIRAAVSEARHQHQASESRLEDLRNRVVEDVFDLIATAESTRDTLQLLREDIIPKTRRSLDLSLEEYSEGKTEYVQLIANWRALLKYRITEFRLISEYNQTMASLSRAVGHEHLEQALMLDSQPMVDIQAVQPE